MRSDFSLNNIRTCIMKKTTKQMPSFCGGVIRTIFPYVPEAAICVPVRMPAIQTDASRLSPRTRPS